jgi:hypothetical protein
LFQVDPFLLIPIAIDRPDLMSSAYYYTTPSCSAGSCATLTVVIIVATADTFGVYMNGTLLPSITFAAVSGSNFSTAKIYIRPGLGVVCHNTRRPLAVTLYAYANQESSAMNVPGINGLQCGPSSTVTTQRTTVNAASSATPCKHASQLLQTFSAYFSHTDNVVLYLQP